jgi:ppGpp synthetase/RelA/SpoT-type nucleotidyltranferase
VTEQQIIERYETEKPMFEAWGNYVLETIILQLSEQGYSPDTLLKIPAIPRIKENKSLIEKALYRGKSYSNPYDEITDKVGIRFVVLNLDEIPVINSLIESCGIWEISKDKDFKKEKAEKPEFFAYQSIHYIIRNKQNIDDTIHISKGVPCEIQIRTLLQHSYAELSHDVAYKKEEHISPEMRRIFARSMALIETTDLLFREVRNMVNTDESKFKEFVEIFAKEKDNQEYIPKLNRLIFDAYQGVVNEQSVSYMDVQTFIKENDFLYRNVKDSKQIFYKQPILFLVYYLIQHYKNQAYQNWPLTDTELRPLFNSLGISMGM